MTVRYGGGCLRPPHTYDKGNIFFCHPKKKRIVNLLYISCIVLVGSKVTPMFWCSGLMVTLPAFTGGGRPQMLDDPLCIISDKPMTFCKIAG